MSRIALALSLIPFLSGPALAQQTIPAPVVPPAPPKISMPTASESPSSSSTASPDDFTTVGRPESTMAPLDNDSPVVVQRPSPAAPVTAGEKVIAPFDVSGRARVVDGNTIIVRGTTILLRGADAPENGQTCLDLVGVPWDCFGRSRSRLMALVGGGSVDCRNVDPYSGSAQCFAGGRDLSETLIAEGLAVAAQGDRSYAGVEMLAKSSRKGVWSGRFDMPWTFLARR